MARKTKHIASISLGIMGVGFVGTLFMPMNVTGNVLQGGFEGGLVGGLADWFAVTALFRHPLGLPIPHTALVKRNRKKITDQFIQVLEQDWLSKESIQEKIQQVSFSHIIADALEREQTQEILISTIRSKALDLLQTTDIRKLAGFCEPVLRQVIQKMDVQGITLELVQQLVQHEYDVKGFDYVLDKVEGWLMQESAKSFLGATAIGALQRTEWDGFMQFAMRQVLNMINEDKIGGILQQLISKGIRDLREPDHANRQALTAFIRNELLRLPMQTGFVKGIEHWLNSVMETLELHSRLAEALMILKDQVIIFLTTDRFESLIRRFLKLLIRYLNEHADANAALEKAIQQQISYFIDANHAKIGELVAENLNRLDDDELIAMMEDRLGQDLQWIRVNGAVCGWLIGLIIAGLKVIVHP